MRKRYFLLKIIEKSDSRGRRAAVFRDTTATAEELLEAWDHGAHVPEDRQELYNQKDDANSSVLCSEAKEKDQGEWREDSDWGNPTLLAKHLLDLALEAR